MIKPLEKGRPRGSYSIITQTRTGDSKSEVMRVGGASWGTGGGEEGNLGRPNPTDLPMSYFQPRQPNDTADKNTIIEKLIVCRKSRIAREFIDRDANVWTATGR